MATTAIQAWAKQKVDNIGNYDAEPLSESKITNDNLRQQQKNDAHVFKILGPKGYKKLHRTTYNEKAAPDKTTAREALIAALSTSFGDQLLQDNVIQESEIPLAQIAERAARVPNGPQNLQELYEAAIREERESRAYKNAAFLKSIEVYNGGNFSNAEEEAHVIIIAGPSGSGKSRVRPDIVNTATEGVLAKDADPANIKDHQHIVVTVDGGIERDVSQVRNLMNRTALKLGYGGIKDLEKITTKATKGPKLKTIIENAANANHMHLVIASTTPQKELDKYMGSDSKRTVSYSFVENRWETVKIMSHHRAFARIGTPYPNIDKIDKPPESKKHGGFKSYAWGALAAKQAGKEYLKRQKQKKSKQKGEKLPKKRKRTLEKAEILRVTKDLVYMKYIYENGIPTDIKPSKNGFLMTERQVNAWRQFKKENPHANVEKWYELNKTNDTLVAEKITKGSSKQSIQEIEESQRQEINRLCLTLKENESKNKSKNKFKLRLLRNHAAMQMQDLLFLFENIEKIKRFSWPYSAASKDLINHLLEKQITLIENPNTSLAQKGILLEQIERLKQKLLMLKKDDKTLHFNEIVQKIDSFKMKFTNSPSQPSPVLFEPHAPTFPPHPQEHLSRDKMRPTSLVLLEETEVASINDKIKAHAHLEVSQPIAEHNHKVKLLAISGKDPVHAVNTYTALQGTPYILEISGNRPEAEIEKFAIEQLMACKENTIITGIKINNKSEPEKFTLWVEKAKALKKQSSPIATVNDSTKPPQHFKHS